MYKVENHDVRLLEEIVLNNFCNKMFKYLKMQKIISIYIVFDVKR